MRKFFVWAIIFLLPTPLYADTVTLRDGRILHGVVTEDQRGNRAIKMDVYSESMVIPRTAIFSIAKEDRKEGMATTSSSSGRVSSSRKSGPKIPSPAFQGEPPPPTP